LVLRPSTIKLNSYYYEFSLIQICYISNITIMFIDIINKVRMLILIIKLWLKELIFGRKSVTRNFDCGNEKASYWNGRWKRFTTTSSFLSSSLSQNHYLYSTHSNSTKTPTSTPTHSDPHIPINSSKFLTTFFGVKKEI